MVLLLLLLPVVVFVIGCILPQLEASLGANGVLLTWAGTFDGEVQQGLAGRCRSHVLFVCHDHEHPGHTTGPDCHSIRAALTRIACLVPILVGKSWQVGVQIARVCARALMIMIRGLRYSYVQRAARILRSGVITLVCISAAVRVRAVRLG